MTVVILYIDSPGEVSLKIRTPYKFMLFASGPVNFSKPRLKKRGVGRLRERNRAGSSLQGSVRFARLLPRQFHTSASF